MKILKYLKFFVITIALVKLIFDTLVFLEPLANPSGEVSEGTYRGLAIGSSKVKVIYALRVTSQHVKFAGYRTNDEFVFVPSLSPNVKEVSSLYSSDKWILEYPGFHQETIVLVFKDDKLFLITYNRNWLYP